MSSSEKMVLLSAKSTFFQKFLYAPLTYIICLGLAYFIWISNWDMAIKIVIIVIVFASMVHKVKEPYLIKKVSLSKNSLVITNYVTTIEVSFGDIRDCLFEDGFGKIKLKKLTVFGDEITFALKYKDLFNHYILDRGIESIDLIKEKIS
jgi:hypothetical protein